MTEDSQEFDDDQVSIPSDIEDESDKMSTTPGKQEEDSGLIIQPSEDMGDKKEIGRDEKPRKRKGVSNRARAKQLQKGGMRHPRQSCSERLFTYLKIA